MFGRWIRNNPDLDSGKGYCVVDQDYFVHAFKTYGNRAFQCLMMLEIKTLGAKVTDAQRDTLHIVNQLMRNRRETSTSNGQATRFQSGFGVSTVRSLMARGDVRVRAYGVHVLTFSGLGPDDSDTTHWDKKEINLEQLTALLRFDLSPDTLAPLDLRRHHKTHENQTLELSGLDDD